MVRGSKASPRHEGDGKACQPSQRPSGVLGEASVQAALQAAHGRPDPVLGIHCCRVDSMCRMLRSLRHRCQSARGAAATPAKLGAPPHQPHLPRLDNLHDRWRTPLPHQATQLGSAITSCPGPAVRRLLALSPAGTDLCHLLLQLAGLRARLLDDFLPRRQRHGCGQHNRSCDDKRSLLLAALGRWARPQRHPAA